MREPIAVEVVRYRCAVPTCPKSYADRSRARKHAAICPRDPDNRSCLSCAHHVEGEMGAPGEPWDPGTPRGCALGLNAGPPLPRQCPSWTPSGSPEEREA